jgi:hypothetical protein
MLRSRAVRVLFQLVTGVAVMAAAIAGLTDRPWICIGALAVAVCAAVMVNKESDHG